MIDKVQKIREGVKRLKFNLIYGACSSQIAMETRCKEEAYNEVLALLNTMQEEPLSNKTEKAIDELSNSIADELTKQLENNLKEAIVSEDLEKAAEEWDESLYRSDAFKAGAKWLSNIICSEIEKRLRYMQYAPHRADTYKELKSLLAYIKSYV